MKKFRLTAIAALVAIASVGAVKASESFRATTHWYDANTNAYIGSTTDASIPPSGCSSGLTLCANGRATQNPSAPVIAQAFKQ